MRSYLDKELVTRVAQPRRCNKMPARIAMWGQYLGRSAGSGGIVLSH